MLAIRISDPIGGSSVSGCQNKEGGRPRGLQIWGPGVPHVPSLPIPLESWDIFLSCVGDSLVWVSVWGICAVSGLWALCREGCGFPLGFGGLPEVWETAGFGFGGVIGTPTPSEIFIKGDRVFLEWSIALCRFGGRGAIVVRGGWPPGCHFFVPWGVTSQKFLVQFLGHMLAWIVSGAHVGDLDVESVGGPQG